MADLTKEGLRRNPFIFLGHFNIPFQGALEKLAKSRNPFIFLGHFNSQPLRLNIYAKGRNPFIFLGHFNAVSADPRRLFQVGEVAIPSFS